MSYTVESVFNLRDNISGTIYNIRGNLNNLAATVTTINNQIANFGNQLNRINPQNLGNRIMVVNNVVNNLGSTVNHTNNDFRSFNQTINNTNNNIININNSSNNLGGTLDSVSSKINRLVTALAGFVGVKAAKNYFVDSNADMEQYQNTLSVVLKDSEKAKEMLSWANKFAIETPFEIPEIVEGTVKLEAYGMKAKEVLGITGDMASVMGKPLMQAIEAVADAQTGELERLKEFGITKKMIEAQSQKMKLKVIDKKGSITDVDGFNKALFALMDERYKGGMDMQSRSYKGMISNLQDFMGNMGRELGKPIFDSLTVGLKKVIDITDELQNSGTLNDWTNKGKLAIQSFIDKAQSGYRAVYALIAGNSFDAVVNLSNFFGGTIDYSAITGVVNVIGSVRNTIVTVSEDIYGITSNLFRYGSSLGNAFEPLTNALWNGLVFTVQAAGEAVTGLTGFLRENKELVETLVPFVVGYGTALALVELNQIRLLATTKLLTLATATWNAIINLNPFVLIATGIIAASILIYQNWDSLKLVLQGVWLKAKEAFGNIKLFFLEVISEITDRSQWLINLLPASIQNSFNQMKNSVITSMEEARKEIESIKKEQIAVQIKQDILTRSKSGDKPIKDDFDQLAKEKFDRNKMLQKPESKVETALNSISKSTADTAKNTKKTKKSNDDILRKLNIEYTDLLLNNIRKMFDGDKTAQIKQASITVASPVQSSLLSRQNEGLKQIEKNRDNSHNLQNVENIRNNKSSNVVVNIPKFADQIKIANEVDKEAFFNEIDLRLSHTIKTTLANI
ncbi:hypothetical protein EEL31_23875 [Brevibacillus laterosporus]|nr:hypothetical protein [Brevibacillus laterosporus]TPG71170.1 hypothetical protein EEL31_23875 [Brevibacillus laterosporus]